jgi:tRNA G18 (ribose-2'-O)-methylase SpoU
MLQEQQNEIAEDSRAIVDWLKGMSNEEIRKTLEPMRHNFSLAIDNRCQNLNAGTLLRSSANFLAKNVFFYGRRAYNRKPSIGAYAFSHVHVAHDMNELEELIKKEKVDKIVAIDNNIDYKVQQLHSYHWDVNKHTLIFMGSEGEGLPGEILDRADDIVEIQGFGTPRSINVSCAGTVIMYDYCMKCGLFE